MAKYTLKLLWYEHLSRKNKKMLKNVKVLLYAYFYNIPLNELGQTFFSIHNLTFSRLPNIGKVRIKVEPKNNYFS